MSIASNQSAAHRFFDELLSGHDLNVADLLCAADITYRSPTGAHQDLDDVKGHFRRTFTALPDLQAQVTYVLAGKDQVVARACIHATHTGDVPDLPASGRRISIPVFYAFSFQHGRIRDIELCYDAQTFLSEITSVYPVAAR